MLVQKTLAESLEWAPGRVMTPASAARVVASTGTISRSMSPAVGSGFSFPVPRCMCQVTFGEASYSSPAE